MLVYLLLAAIAVIVFEGISKTLSSMEGFVVDESGASAPSNCNLQHQNAGNISALKSHLDDISSPGGLRSEIEELMRQAETNKRTLKEISSEIHSQASKLMGKLPDKD